MDELAPKARFDALAELFGLDEPALDAIRHTINPLLPQLQQLARMWDDTLRGPAAARVVGDLPAKQRADLQGRLASFIMRTINLVFDDDYCDYAQAFARDPAVPRQVIPVALAVAWEFVAITLADKADDRRKRHEALTAWHRLVCALREFAA